MRVVGKILLGLLAVVLVLALVASLLLVWAVRRPFPQTDGELRVAGLSGDVEVIRNAQGIPDIYADTPEDLFTAMGYVVAQDRFYQMDFNRHLTSGRLSEMLGSATVNEDAFLRTMGWRKVAEQEYRMLAPEARTMLDSYAAGINRYLSGKSNGEVSFEYTILGLTNPEYTIERWDPVDSVAWLKAMAFDLMGNMDQEISRVLTSATVGIRRAEQLFPPYPYERNGTIISDAENRNLAQSQARQATAAAVRTSKSAAGALERTLAAQTSLSGLMGTQGDGIGSDSWVVSGQHTKTGEPFLADDMHLGPQMPSIWYQAGLHCRKVSLSCPYDVAGFVLPSVPGVIVGHNADIAWGFTNLGPDVADLVLEQVQGDDYVVEGRRHPIKVEHEVIKVAGGDDIDLAIRSTRNGPILSDVYGEAADTYVEVGEEAPVPAPGQQQASPARRGTGYAVSLKWTALSPLNVMDAVPVLNTAKNFKQFRTAASLFAVPAQNIVFADTKGNIGYQTPGRIPIRQGYDGHWPVPGWDSKFRWSGYLAFEDLPSIKNPPAGWITTANQYVVPADSPQADVQTDVYSYGARARRINVRLSQIRNDARKFTVDDMQDVQFDMGNDLAEWLAPKLVKYTPGGSTDQAVRLLDGWNTQQPADSAAAAYFNAFYRALTERLFTDELGEESTSGFNAGDRFWEIIRVLWERPNDPWWDDTATPQRENRDDTVNSSLVAGSDELIGELGSDPNSWRWGELHTLTVENQSLGQSGIGPIEAIFNRGPIETNGGGSIPLATNWWPSEGYEVTAVPSMREVVDLQDLDRSTWVNLTGNSGHAYNANYVDQLDSWNEGTQYPWAFTPGAVRASGGQTLTLRP